MKENDELTVVREIVASSPDRRIAGSALALSLKARGVNWSPQSLGFRNLRELVSRMVPDVAIVDRAGMDVIYGLAAESRTQRSAPFASSTGTEDFWRIWVSPNSPIVLGVSPAGDVSALPRGASAPSDSWVLEPPAGGAHREIAKAFAEAVAPGDRAALESVLEKAGESWWQSWLKTIRTTGHAQEWNEFRRRALEGLLLAQLREKGAEDLKATMILGRVTESHAQATKRLRQSVRRSGDHQDEAALRELVVQVIQSMSADELRALRLPVGLILDALGKLRPRQ